jgi:plastocyanin
MLLRRATATLLAVPLLLVTGCGEVKRLQPNEEVAKPVALDKPKPTINPGPTSPPPTTAAPAPTSAAPTGEPTGEPTGGTEVKGTIGNAFEPAKLEIKAGDTVTWTLDGAHSVTGGTDGTGKPDPASPMKSEIGVPTYKATFDKPGTYPYYCFPHFSVGMKGEIVVK